MVDSSPAPTEYLMIRYLLDTIRTWLFPPPTSTPPAPTQQKRPLRIKLETEHIATVTTEDWCLACNSAPIVLMFAWRWNDGPPKVDTRTTCKCDL